MVHTNYEQQDHVPRRQAAARELRVSVGVRGGWGAYGSGVRDKEQDRVPRPSRCARTGMWHFAHGALGLGFGA